MNGFAKSFGSAFKAVALVWLIHFVGLLLPFHVQNLGIHPHRFSGLFGIFTAPLLHANLYHLVANTTALLILLTIALAYDQKIAIKAVLIIVIIGGFGTWIFGNSGFVHIGAGGVIFGLVGYLLFLGFYGRDLKSLLVSVIVFFMYGGTLMYLLVPVYGISWSSHFFGFIGGVCAAKQLGKKSQ